MLRGKKKEVAHELKGKRVDDVDEEMVDRSGRGGQEKIRECYEGVQ